MSGMQPLLQQYRDKDKEELERWEENFRKAYQEMAARKGLSPDPDDPAHHYDYRALFKESGSLEPDETGHFPSKYKTEGHPNLIVDGVDTKTGKPVPQGPWYATGDEASGRLLRDKELEEKIIANAKSKTIMGDMQETIKEEKAKIEEIPEPPATKIWDYRKEEPSEPVDFIRKWREENKVVPEDPHDINAMLGYDHPIGFNITDFPEKYNEQKDELDFLKKEGLYWQSQIGIHPEAEKNLEEVRHKYNSIVAYEKDSPRYSYATWQIQDIHREDPTWGDIVEHGTKAGIWQYVEGIAYIGELGLAGTMTLTDQVFQRLGHGDAYNPDEARLVLDVLMQIRELAEQNVATNYEQAEANSKLKNILFQTLTNAVPMMLSLPTGKLLGDILFPTIQGSYTAASLNKISTGSLHPEMKDYIDQMKTMIPFGSYAAGQSAKDFGMRWEAKHGEPPPLWLQFLVGVGGGMGEVAAEAPVLVNWQKLFTGGKLPVMEVGAARLIKASVTGERAQKVITNIMDFARHHYMPEIRQELMMDFLAYAMYTATGLDAPELLELANLGQTVMSSIYLTSFMMLGGVGSSTIANTIEGTLSRTFQSQSVQSQVAGLMHLLETHMPQLYQPGTLGFGIGALFGSDGKRITKKMQQTQKIDARLNPIMYERIGHELVRTENQRKADLVTVEMQRAKELGMLDELQRYGWIEDTPGVLAEPYARMEYRAEHRDFQGIDYSHMPQGQQQPAQQAVQKGKEQIVKKQQEVIDKTLVPKKRAQGAGVVINQLRKSPNIQQTTAEVRQRIFTEMNKGADKQQSRIDVSDLNLSEKQLQNLQEVGVGIEVTAPEGVQQTFLNINRLLERVAEARGQVKTGEQQVVQQKETEVKTKREVYLDQQEAKVQQKIDTQVKRMVDKGMPFAKAIKHDSLKSLRKQIEGIQAQRQKTLKLKETKRKEIKKQPVQKEVPIQQIAEQTKGAKKKLEAMQQKYNKEISQIRERMKEQRFNKTEYNNMIKDLKQRYIKELQAALPLERRGHKSYLAKIKNITTLAHLETAINELYVRATKEIRQDLTRKIDTLLKGIKPKKDVKRGIILGRYDSGGHILFETIKSYVHKDAIFLNNMIEKLTDLVIQNEQWTQMKELDHLTDREMSRKLQADMNSEYAQIMIEGLKLCGTPHMTNKQLANLYTMLKELKKQGAQKLTDRLNRRIEERHILGETFVEKITDGKGVQRHLPQERLIKRESALEKIILWQLGWDSLLDTLSKHDKDSKPYQSELNKVGNEAHLARTKEQDAMERMQRMISDNAMRIFGKQSDAALVQMFKLMSTEQQNLGTFKLAQKLDMDGNPIPLKKGQSETFTLQLTKGEIGQKFLELRDPSLAKAFDDMGWTKEMKDAINNALTKQEKAWFLSFSKIYQDIYARAGKVYKELFGITLPINKYYVPINRELGDLIAREETLFQKEAQHFGSYMSKHTRHRVFNRQGLKFTDANTVMINYMTQMEHFTAWAEPCNKLRSIFNQQDVRMAILQNFGKAHLARINEYINMMARGGMETVQIVTWADKLRANFTKATLGLKPLIALKQIPSVLAFATEMSNTDFVSGIHSFWRNPKANAQLLMKLSPYLRNRFMQGYERDVKLAMQQQWYQNIVGSNKINNILMGMIRGGDRLAVLQGTWAKFQEQMKGKKWTQDNMKEAIAEAERTVKRTQPTSEHETLSSIQNWGSIGKMASMFRNQPNKYFRIFYDNARNLYYQRGDKNLAMKNMLLTWVVLPSIFQWIAAGLDWDWQDQSRAMILGPINNLVIGGQLAQSVWNWGTERGFTHRVSPAFSMFDDMQRIITRMQKLRQPWDQITSDDLFDWAERSLKIAGQMSGLPMPYAVQVEQALRKGDPRMLIFSEYVLNRKDGIDKKKSVGYNGYRPAYLDIGKGSISSKGKPKYLSIGRPSYL